MLGSPAGCANARRGCVDGIRPEFPDKWGQIAIFAPETGTLYPLIWLTRGAFPQPGHSRPA